MALRTVRGERHVVDFIRRLFGDGATVMPPVVVAGLASRGFGVRLRRPLGEWGSLPLARTLFLLEPLEKFRLPFEQRLDLRGEPGDLAFELCNPRLALCIQRLELRHALPERRVLDQQLVVGGPSTIHGPHSLIHRRSQGKINSQGGKLVRATNAIRMVDAGE
jgi:hypothetical protein